MKERVRVIRILEYVGSRDWVEDTLNKSGVPLRGHKVYMDNKITSTVLGDFPEVIETVINQEEIQTNE